MPLALGALQAHAMSSPSLTRAGIGMLGNLACANRRAVERAVGAEYAADFTGATAAAVAAGLQAIASEDDRANGNANDGATKSDAHADEGGAGGGDDGSDGGGEREGGGEHGGAGGGGEGGAGEDGAGAEDATGAEKRPPSALRTAGAPTPRVAIGGASGGQTQTQRKQRPTSAPCGRHELERQRQLRRQAAQQQQRRSGLLLTVPPTRLAAAAEKEPELPDLGGARGAASPHAYVACDAHGGTGASPRPRGFSEPDGRLFEYGRIAQPRGLGCSLHQSRSPSVAEFDPRRVAAALQQSDDRPHKGGGFVMRIPSSSSAARFHPTGGSPSAVSKSPSVSTSAARPLRSGAGGPTYGQRTSQQPHQSGTGRV